jgi:hypothetical protein
MPFDYVDEVTPGDAGDRPIPPQRDHLASDRALGIGGRQPGDVALDEHLGDAREGVLALAVRRRDVWHGSSISTSAARAFPFPPSRGDRAGHPEQTLKRTVSVMITVITVVMITFALVMITEARRSSRPARSGARRTHRETDDGGRVGSPPVRSRRPPAFLGGPYRSAHHGRRLEGGGVNFPGAQAGPAGLRESWSGCCQAWPPCSGAHATDRGWPASAATDPAPSPQNFPSRNAISGVIGAVSA